MSKSAVPWVVGRTKSADIGMHSIDRFGTLSDITKKACQAPFSLLMSEMSTMN